MTSIKEKINVNIFRRESIAALRIERKNFPNCFDSCESHLLDCWMGPKQLARCTRIGSGGWWNTNGWRNKKRKHILKAPPNCFISARLSKCSRAAMPDENSFSVLSSLDDLNPDASRLRGRKTYFQCHNLWDTFFTREACWLWGGIESGKKKSVYMMALTRRQLFVVWGAVGQDIYVYDSCANILR